MKEGTKNLKDFITNKICCLILADVLAGDIFLSTSLRVVPKHRITIYKLSVLFDLDSILLVPRQDLHGVFPCYI